MNEPRKVWTYYIARDSLGGVLADECTLWWIKPTRVKHNYRVTWVPTDPRNDGHLGTHPIAHIEAWFRTTPDSDLQLIKIEQYATEDKRQ